jgi:hypothetical protein
MPTDLGKQFFANHNYLHTLFAQSNQVSNLDELLLALIKHQQMQNILSENSLDIFMRRYALLIGNDYRRTKLFLQRVEPLVNVNQN